MEIRIPRKNVKVMPEREKRTVYIMNQSGQMAGRTARTTGKSDGTRIIRVTRDIDVNKDNKITSRDFRKGQIIGRVPKGPMPRTIVVNRHYRQGNPVGKHIRVTRA